MVLVVRVDAEDLTVKARQLRDQAKHLQIRIADAATEAVRSHLKPRIAELAPEYLPNRYAGVYAPSIRVRAVVHYGHKGGVSAIISAPYGKQGREVRAIERGDLRHPLFGNRNHWYGQKVRRRLHANALKSVKPQIVKKLDEELDKIKRELEV